MSPSLLKQNRLSKATVSSRGNGPATVTASFTTGAGRAEGWLWKLGRGLKPRWARRYCVLRPTPHGSESEPMEDDQASHSHCRAGRLYYYRERPVDNVALLQGSGKDRSEQGWVSLTDALGVMMTDQGDQGDRGDRGDEREVIDRSASSASSAGSADSRDSRDRPSSLLRPSSKRISSRLAALRGVGRTTGGGGKPRPKAPFPFCFEVSKSEERRGEARRSEERHRGARGAGETSE